MSKLTFKELKRLLMEELEADNDVQDEPESVKTRNVLNSLLGDEYNAWKQYKMMEIAAKGKSLARVVEIFKEAGKDEMEDHFDNLAKWMQSAGMQPLNDPEELDRVCGCPFKKVELEQDTASLVEMAVEAENAAINAYTITMEMDCVKQYPDLVYLLAEFLRDEREHLLMLQDVQTQINGFDGDEPEEQEVDDDDNEVVQEGMVDDGIYDQLKKGNITPEQAYNWINADDAGKNKIIGDMASGLGYPDITDRAGLDKAIADQVKKKSWGLASYDPGDFDKAIGRLAGEYTPSVGGATTPGTSPSPSIPSPGNTATTLSFGSGAFSSPTTL